MPRARHFFLTALTALIAAVALGTAACGDGAGAGGGGGGDTVPGDIPFCLPTCEVATDCPGGGMANYACENGYCVDAEADSDDQNSCSSDSDCGDLTCRNGQCVCTSDEQCPGDLFCRSNGACGCSSDDQCNFGGGVDSCIQGYCGCSSDASCDVLEQLGDSEFACAAP